MKRLPVALLLGLALQLVLLWAHELWSLTHAMNGPGAMVAVELAYAGGYLASLIVLAVGLHDLAQRTTRRSVRVAFGFSLALIAAALFEVAREAFAIGDPMQWWYYAATARWMFGLGLVIAIAVAAYRQAPQLAFAAVTILAAVWVPAIFRVHILDALPLSGDQRRIAYDLLGTAGIALQLAMLAAIETTDATPRPTLARDGMSLAARGYYLRIAAFGATILLMLMVLFDHGRDTDDIVRLAVYGGFLVNAIAFAMVGLGALRALRSAHAGLGTIAMGIAATANLWCAAAALNKLAVYYRLVHTGYGPVGDEVYTALDVALPIVAMIGGVVLTTAVARFARDRGDNAMAGGAAATGVGFAMLMIASTGLSSYLAVDAPSLASMLGMVVIGAGCGLASQAILGRLCRRAEDALANGATLPTATVV